LLVSRGPREWVGIDLASGAYIRFAHPGESAPNGARPGKSAIQFTLGEAALGDPARPEAVQPEGELVLLPPPRRRPTRRLLDALTQADRPGATLLGSHGPSIAYVDLDPDATSLVLLRVSKDFEVVATEGGDVLATVTFGGTTQLLPVVDPPLRRAAMTAWPRPLSGASLATALGHRAGYLLVGLDAVNQGHVKKVVLAVLER
jgi:hypothetical protein